MWSQTGKYSAVTWLQPFKKKRDLALCNDTIHFYGESKIWLRKRNLTVLLRIFESVKFKTGPSRDIYSAIISSNKPPDWFSVTTSIKEISPYWNSKWVFFFCLKVVLEDYAHRALAVVHHCVPLLILSVLQTYSTPQSGLKTAGSFFILFFFSFPLFDWLEPKWLLSKTLKNLHKRC